jgi:glycolate oxidase FAD binding subunit
MGVIQLDRFETEIPGGPEGIHLAPGSPDEVAIILKEASGSGTPVRVWGGGTKQKLGSPPPPGWVLSTERLAGVEKWEPDDLTMVVGAGSRVGELEAMLGERSQTAVLPETDPFATIGGVIATGASSLKRGRLLGVRERVLEVTLVTGDGRVIRSGGRVVKNVSGFDIHKAAVGAFGSLGVIVSACFKLWPVPPAGATIVLDDPDFPSLPTRPLAVLEDPSGTTLFLWGTEAEIAEHMQRIPGRATPGHSWPNDPPGPFRWSLRVPPALTSEGIAKAAPWRYLAIHGVGEVRLGSDTPEGASHLRSWAVSVGGSLVLVDHPGEFPPLDPWGSALDAPDVQRSLIAQFDPARIINPGRLPGSL